MIAWLGPGPPPNTIHNIPFGLLLSVVLSVLAVIAVAAVVLRHTDSAGRLTGGVLGSVLGITLTCFPFIAQLFVAGSLTAEVPEWLPNWWPWQKPATALFLGTFVGFFLRYPVAYRWSHPAKSGHRTTIRV
ncbi:MAG: hypothetical protein ACPGVU_07885 [Limisphaerales bacterium]